MDIDNLIREKRNNFINNERVIEYLNLLSENKHLFTSILINSKWEKNLYEVIDDKIIFLSSAKANKVSEHKLQLKFIDKFNIENSKEYLSDISDILLEENLTLNIKQLMKGLNSFLSLTFNTTEEETTKIYAFNYFYSIIEKLRADIEKETKKIPCQIQSELYSFISLLMQTYMINSFSFHFSLLELLLTLINKISFDSASNSKLIAGIIKEALIIYTNLTEQSDFTTIKQTKIGKTNKKDKSINMLQIAKGNIDYDKYISYSIENQSDILQLQFTILNLCFNKEFYDKEEIAILDLLSSITNKLYYKSLYFINQDLKEKIIFFLIQVVKCEGFITPIKTTDPLISERKRKEKLNIELMVKQAYNQHNLNKVLLRLFLELHIHSSDKDEDNSSLCIVDYGKSIWECKLKLNLKEETQV